MRCERLKKLPGATREKREEEREWERERGKAEERERGKRKDYLYVCQYIIYGTEYLCMYVCMYISNTSVSWQSLRV
jgi:hypothetical protein